MSDYDFLTGLWEKMTLHERNFYGGFICSMAFAEAAEGNGPLKMHLPDTHTILYTARRKGKPPRNWRGYVDYTETTFDPLKLMAAEQQLDDEGGILTLLFRIEYYGDSQDFPGLYATLIDTETDEYSYEEVWGQLTEDGWCYSVDAVREMRDRVASTRNQRRSVV